MIPSRYLFILTFELSEMANAIGTLRERYQDVQDFQDGNLYCMLLVILRTFRFFYHKNLNVKLPIPKNQSKFMFLIEEIKKNSLF